ncbi:MULTISPECIES: TetR/AcrR family transcriptional regulator [Micrococcales]|uniref:TetR/AcrR family transcriptional regulator n=1 Tax=Micrococcales TaxID=85006 RepID=UPI000AAD039C|nr:MULTISPECIES: TetR/AcrR family transcriptional regulator [Micrococcales]
MNTNDAVKIRKVPPAEADALDGRATRWQNHRKVRRRQLLREARHAIHKIGPQASMEEIAQHSGTSKSVYYRYFTDKAGLSQALGEFLLAGLEQRIVEAAANGSSPSDTVHRMIDAYLVMVQRSPSIHEFVSSHAGLGWARPDEGDEPTASLGLFADHVAKVLLDSLHNVAGELRGTELSDEVTQDYWARAVVGMVQSVTNKWSRAYVEGVAPPREQTVDQLTRWILMPLEQSR